MLPEMSFHTRPLSSRVRPAAPVNSPSRSAEARRDESQLLDVPLHIQEALVLQDLLSVLNVRLVSALSVSRAAVLTLICLRACQGIEGDLVTFHPDYDPMDEQDRIKGPQWEIDSGLGASAYLPA